MNNKKVLIFDLDDTLAKSKSPITNEMSTLLQKLVAKYYICIITGGAWKQIYEQVIKQLHCTDEAILKKFYFMPTCGAQCYIFKNKQWIKLYSNDIPINKKQDIVKNIETYARKMNLWPLTPYGDVIEDRGTQITFSALGQQAPVEKKNEWKIKNNLAKNKLCKTLQTKMKEFEVRLGGSTSIDITNKNIDKAFGIKQLLAILKKANSNIDIKDFLFFGDNLQKNGNDYCVKQMGVDSIEVKSANDTYNILLTLI